LAADNPAGPAPIIATIFFEFFGFNPFLIFKILFLLASMGLFSLCYYEL